MTNSFELTGSEEADKTFIDEKIEVETETSLGKRARERNPEAAPES